MPAFKEDGTELLLISDTMKPYLSTPSKTPSWNQNQVTSMKNLKNQI
jgi:hypothetical protein